MRAPRHRRIRAVGRVLLGVLGVAALSIGGFAAGVRSVRTLTTSVAPATEVGAPSTWTVEEGEVGRSLELAGVLRLPSRPGPASMVEGVVTHVDADRQRTAELGTVLHRIELRPVTAGEGAIPSFRDLGIGDRGADVGQLRRHLCALGALRSCRPIEDFDEAVEAAVRRWQVGLGLEADGRVRVGDILWFSDLPVEVRPAAALEVGTRLGVDDRPYAIVDGTPVLEVPIGPDQASQIPVGTEAVIDGELPARVAAFGPGPSEATGRAEDALESEADGSLAPESGLQLRLVDPETDRSPCADGRCDDRLAGAASVEVVVEVVLVPRIVGPVVPAVAVRTAVDGRTYVVEEGGTERTVFVAGTAGGMRAVVGVRVGAQVLIPDPADP